MMRHTHAQLRSARHRTAFTIVEILIVVTIIVLLLSILIVAVNAAQKAAKRANTEALMNTISQALTRFESDIGYLPPVLDPQRALPFNSVPDPGLTANLYSSRMQEWYSITSLADYLLGYGGHYEDGYGIEPDNAASSGRRWAEEAPPLGIRDPGFDGVWGATVNGSGSGAVFDRMRLGIGANATTGREGDPFTIDQGKVFGPYFELKDPDLLGSIRVVGGNVQGPFFPGDDNYDPDGIKVICDYWGQPIRYYRLPYPRGGLNIRYRPDTIEYMPSLSDVFVLRPFTVPSGQETNTFFADSNGDTITSAELDSKTFALFSRGPDQALNAEVRNDSQTGQQEFNRDNIVRTGP